MDEQNFPNIFDEPINQPQPDLPKPNKLERSRTDVIVTGLCSGIAKYISADPSVIRLIALISLLLGFWSVAAYFVAAFLIPPEESNVVLTKEELLFQRKVNFRTVVSGLMILSGLYLGFASIGMFTYDRIFILPNSFMFPFIAIVVGVYYLSIMEAKLIENVNDNPKRFERSRSDKLLFGVCGGFAKYLGVESTTVRIIFLLAALLTLGIFALVYVLFVFLTVREKPLIEL